MIVFVVDANNNIGHPTRRCEMIRKLLKRGEAKVLKGGLKPGQPIVVKLIKKTFSKPIDCEFRVGIDPGYKHIGYCVYKIYNTNIIKLFSKVHNMVLRILNYMFEIETIINVNNTANHVHHIVWKSNRWSDSPFNLILLCPECHKKVHACKVVCPISQ